MSTRRCGEPGRQYGSVSPERRTSLYGRCEREAGAVEDAEGIREFLKARLTNKVPKIVEFLLPREDSGKIFKWNCSIRIGKSREGDLYQISEGMTRLGIPESAGF
jgi:hypothetical protein